MTGTSGGNFNTGSGALVDVLYVRREVKAYALYETEVEHLGHLNFLSSVMFALASGLLAYAMGIYTNAAFVKPEELPATGQVARDIAAPVLIALAVIFVVVGCVTLFRSWRTWEDIKKKSVAQG